MPTSSETKPHMGTGMAASVTAPKPVAETTVATTKSTLEKTEMPQPIESEQITKEDSPNTVTLMGNRSSSPVAVPTSAVEPEKSTATKPAVEPDVAAMESSPRVEPEVEPEIEPEAEPEPEVTTAEIALTVQPEVAVEPTQAVNPTVSSPVEASPPMASTASVKLSAPTEKQVSAGENTEKKEAGKEETIEKNEAPRKLSLKLRLNPKVLKESLKYVPDVEEKPVSPGPDEAENTDMIENEATDSENEAADEKLAPEADEVTTTPVLGDSTSEEPKREKSPVPETVKESPADLLASRKRSLDHAENEISDEPSTKKNHLEESEDKGAESLKSTADITSQTKSTPTIELSKTKEPEEEAEAVAFVPEKNNESTSPAASEGEIIDAEPMEVEKPKEAEKPKLTKQTEKSKLTIRISPPAFTLTAKKAKPTVSEVTPSSPKKEDEEEGDRKSSLSKDSPIAKPGPIKKSSSSSSEDTPDVPKQLSAEPAKSTASVDISKPVSTMASSVKVEGSLEDGLTNVDAENTEDPILTGSENSAFERQESMAESTAESITDHKEEEELERSPLPASGSDDDNSSGRPTSPRSKESTNDLMESNVKSSREKEPLARSGRRAAQKANKRIAARKEQIANDPNLKGKKRKEKLELKLLSQTSEKKEGKRKHGGQDEEENSPQWVQCDNCQKWRVLPPTVSLADLPKHWYCEMNTHDPPRSNCDAPEQTAEEVTRKKKRRKRGRRPNAELLAEANERAEERAERRGSELGSIKLSRLEKLKERSSTKSPTAEKPEDAPKSSSKQRRASSTSTLSSDAPESPRTDNDHTSQAMEQTKKAASSTGKRSKPDRMDDGGNESAPEVPREKKRGRRGRVPKEDKDKEKEKGKSSKGSKGDKDEDDPDNQEWVQCEKCEKWRKLPKHISASELPDTWYCNMNTWDPKAASCNADEDKADPTHRDLNIFGQQNPTYGSSGKLSYRTLIFGTGKRQNRPISERTRAAESLFNSIEEDQSEGNGYPTVMYANSSAFVSRSSNATRNLDAADRIPFFDYMNNSSLWAELHGCNRRNSSSSFNDGIQNFYGQSGPSLEDLPKETSKTLKDIVYHALGTSTLAGHEVLLEAQCRRWEDAPQKWEDLRAFCTIDLIVALLFELVKDGRVEIIKKNGSNTSYTKVNRYRRVALSAKERSASKKSRRSKCMKISKPWKRERSEVKA